MGEQHKPSDVDILYRRVVHRVLQQQPETLRGFTDAPVIVGTKKLRDTINARRAYHHAASIGQHLHLYHAKDRINRGSVPTQLRETLWGIGSSKTQDALGQLPLIPGMRVMALENSAFSKGLVNGAEGTVEEILWEGQDGCRYATTAYIRVPGAGQVCADRETDIVPIFPVTSHFKVQVIVNGKLRTKGVSRQQLPLLPAYTYTDYKSQGKSLQKAIIDLFKESISCSNVSVHFQVCSCFDHSCNLSYVVDCHKSYNRS